MGLSSVDVKIITALHKQGQASPTSLAEVIVGVPRTTLSYRLALLLERGWVEKIRVSGHYEWKCSQSALQLVNEHLVSDEITLSHFPIEQLPQVFEAIFGDSSLERIYFLEPTMATASIHKRFGNEFLSHMALLFKSGKNISEGVTSDALLGYLPQYSQQTLREMRGRMVVIHLVPDQLLRFDDMFIVHKNSVFIINPQKDHITQVVDPSFAA